MRAHKSAPNPAKNSRYEEQSNRRDNGKPGNYGEVLRPQGQSVNSEALLHNIKQNSLLTLISEPGQQSKYAQENKTKAAPEVL